MYVCEREGERERERERERARGEGEGKPGIISNYIKRVHPDLLKVRNMQPIAFGGLPMGGMRGDVGEAKLVSR